MLGYFLSYVIIILFEIILLLKLYKLSIFFILFYYTSFKGILYVLSNLNSTFKVISPHGVIGMGSSLIGDNPWHPNEGMRFICEVALD